MQTLLILFLILLILIICVAVAQGSGKVYWEGIVVHHSGSTYDTYKTIDAYHRSKNWRMCGYHYVIEKDGTVIEGRPLDMAGAHAKTGRPYDRNRSHIGICLCGEDVFTQEQIEKLSSLCWKLSQRFSIKIIERHHEECPGPGVDVKRLELKCL